MKPFCKCNQSELVINNHWREFYEDGSIEDYVTVKCNLCGKTSKKKHRINISDWRCVVGTNEPKGKRGKRCAVKKQKQIRRAVYGDLSVKSEKVRQQGIMANGQIVNTGLRKYYQLEKKGGGEIK